ncbi:MAG: transposase [Megasphaera massiliensis]|uniref:RNA-guided endonuclease TnpB family protein n=1 Tax=Megasphaera massiliensis TaxID=1232428 RepID=UPI001CD641E4|nr:RNA-guided endonuclease TnpB family protein [Megasphaera massiliensis]MCB5735246.1 transposase [Megasphaera massiliensis]UBS53646.1 transposase [Megasphaera massiliensis]
MRKVYDLTKTIKLRIHVSPEQEILFRQMTERYRQACNFVSQHIFDNHFSLAYQNLNKELYSDLRKQFGLKSQLAQSSIKTTIAQYKTVNEQLLHSPFKYKDQDGTWKYITKTLEWLWKPICFKLPQADLVRNRDYSFVDDGKMLSINTLGKRTRCTFEDKPFVEYLNGSWKLGTAKLVELKGLWYLHISITKAVESFRKENVRHIVGIDRGLRFLTVSYDEQGKTSFVSGRKIAAKRHKFLKVRQQLQSKGTKSAKRRLKAISGRENRWMSDVNHQISKTLVEKYGKDTLFVLEDLTGISFEESNLSQHTKVQRSDLRSWPFYQLEQFLTYKAHENHSEVLKISAKYTSLRCPKCNIIHKENRDHSKHLYRCQCGYQSNDDRIGAMNIQHLGIRWILGDNHPRYERIITASE